MKKKILGVMLLSVALMAGLSACGSKSTGKDGENQATKTEDITKFPLEVKNDNKAIKGGTLEVAVVTDTQFQGLFQREFYQDTYDDQFMKPAFQYLFNNDEDFKIVDGGPADLKLDVDKKTAVITLRDNLKWSDGKDVTAEDLIFSYEVIGHKEYTGIRYDDNFTNIEGMEAYHDGQADKISGVEKVNDKEVKISYKEMNPGMLQLSGGVWASALPKHILESVPVKDMESSDAVRKNPISFGPYYMSNIVTGESVEYLPNDYYYGGKPKLDKLILKSVPSSSIVEAMNAKQYDLVFSMPTDIYPTYKDTKGYQMLGRQEQAYTYIGFKMGTFDKEKDTVNYNPKAKMADKDLRQAMGYAMDNNAVGEKFYNGLRSNAATLIPPVFKTFHNSSLKGYTLDLEKAKKILDDAGYKDTDKDGFREDKEGKELVIKLASMSGGETAQPLADYYIQQWKEIGLNVELATGRLIDFQAFYDKIKNDDPEVDVFMGAWGTGTDPSPTGLYGPNSAFNYSRFESEENTKLLKAIDSTDSFDADKRKEAFDKWQAYAAEEAFVIPTLYRNEILPVNNRVKDFTWAYDAKEYPWSTVVVTSESRE